MAAIATTLTMDGISGAQRFEFSFSSPSWSPSGGQAGAADAPELQPESAWSKHLVLLFAAGLVLVCVAGLASAVLLFDEMRAGDVREAAERLRRYEMAMEAERRQQAFDEPRALSDNAPTDVGAGSARVKILAPHLDAGALSTARAIVEAIERGQSKGGDGRQ